MLVELSESIRAFIHRSYFGGAPNQETVVSRRDSALRKISLIAFLCLAAHCIWSASMVTVGSARLLSNWNENTYPESTNIYTAIKGAQTGHLYFPASEPPYVLQPFGPLYYVANVVIAKASHLDFDLVRARARLLTYCCFLSSALFIYLICRKLLFSAADSALAALMFLGQPFFLFWNVTIRPEMMFLAVMLLSLLWAVEGETAGGAGYVLSGALAGLAFLVKQPAIAAPVAVVAILLYRRKFRLSAAYAFGAALPVVLVFGILLWHAGPFVEQFTSVGKGIWSLGQGAQFAFEKFWDSILLFPLLIGGLGFAQAIRGNTPSKIIAAFAVTNWVVGLSGLPQLGSDINYALPGLTGCALLLPFAVEAIRKNVRWKGTFVLIILGLLWTMSKDYERVSWVLSVPTGQSGRSLAALAPYKILSDRALYTLHGRDPDLLDPYTAHELELRQHWDSSRITENVRRGSYDLIVLAGSGKWQEIASFRGLAYFSPVLVQAINENYSVLCSTMTQGVLMPRAREVDAAATLFGPVLGQPCGVGLRGRSPDLKLPPGAR
jgi:hypothetical protein